MVLALALGLTMALVLALALPCPDIKPDPDPNQARFERLGRPLVVSGERQVRTQPSTMRPALVP